MNENYKLCELKGAWIATVYGIDWQKRKMI